MNVLLPTKSEINNAVVKVISGLKPLIDKLSRRCANSVLDPEDVFQEISLKVVEYVTKNFGQDRDLDDLLREGSVVVRNHASSMSAHYARRPDTSLFREELEAAAMNPGNSLHFSSKAPNQADEALFSDAVMKLLDALRADSRNSLELQLFVKNCLAPSKEVLRFYFKWLEETSAENPYRNKGIPPRVIGQALGYDSAKVSRLQRKIAQCCLNLGFGLHEVFGNKFCEGQSEAWFNSYQTTRSEWEISRNLDFFLQTKEQVRHGRTNDCGGGFVAPERSTGEDFVGVYKSAGYRRVMA